MVYLSVASSPKYVTNGKTLLIGYLMSAALTRGLNCLRDYGWL